MRHVLFICGRNRRRSPTAEHLFSSRADFAIASAGLSPDAETPVCSELLEWADLIFVMERVHQKKLSSEFAIWLRNKRVVCLDIPDQFAYMDVKLIELLAAKVGPFLKTS